MVVSRGHARSRDVSGEYAVNDAHEENFPRKMPADAWFGFEGCNRSEVEEQSFRLPDDEILVVLKLPDEAIP